jgi:uncharacterized protein YuzE
MQIYYDATVDVLVIRLQEGKIAESDEVTPGVIVDFNDSGTPLAIEILNARRVLNSDGKLTLELPLQISTDASG